MASFMESAFMVADEAGDGWPAFEELIRRQTAAVKGPLFMTNAGERTERVARPAEEGGGTVERTVTDLFGVFLANLPADRRQYYNCNCCRRFVDRFGGLVTMDTDGNTAPLMWDKTEAQTKGTFQPVVEALSTAVYKAKVTGVFLSSDPVWGTPFNDPGPGSKYEGRRWTHLSCPNPSVFAHKLLTADQVIAERREDFGLLCRTLASTPLDAAREAVRVLEADVLDRSDKSLGMAKWFLDLRVMWEEYKGLLKTNRLWHAVATAPPGFAHARNAMLGTLFTDIMAGMEFEAVRKRWREKMHPLQYQRPTALKAGNIEVAEKVIEKLGAARSLERRYARLDEIHRDFWRYFYWKPTAAAEPAKTGGVFADLKPTVPAKHAKPEVKPLDLPARTLTWARFRAEVLPTAAKIEFEVPHGNQPFVCLVTAVHADAPPILQWDEQTGDPSYPRNPVSWYIRAAGAPAHQWNLRAGTWVAVNAILPGPPEWQRPELFGHHGNRVVFVLQDARDAVHRCGGLFPECLRAEFREAKAAIEALNNKGGPAAAPEDAGDANGIVFARGADQRWDCRVRVTDAAGNRADYRVDRWD